MSRNLRLQVMLNAVDRVTGPLKRMRQGAGQTGQVMRETRDQLKELQRTQSDLTSYRKANAAMRTNTRAIRDARARNHQYTQALEQQRQTHANVKSGLTVARREYDRLAKELLRTKQPSDQLTASLERARVRLHGQQTEFDRSARAMREYRNRTRHAGEEVARLTRNHATQTERVRGLKTRLDEAGISTDNLGRSARELRTREERLNTALQQQKRHLSEVADRQRRLTQARDRYQNSMGNVARMQGVGAGMLGTGLAKGYAASRLLTPGVAWGEQMSALRSVGGYGEDDERYLALRQQSRDLGASTAFSANEVGAGQEFLMRAGMSSDAIKASMDDVLALALANNTELSRAADIASNIGSSFKVNLEGEGEFARVADILSGTARRTNVNLEMLGETFKYLGNLEGLDISLEQAAAMTGLMGNIGIQGSQAGTAVRALGNRLTKPTATAAGLMEQYGIEVANAQGGMRDIEEILNDTFQATKDLGNVQRAGILQEIFGVEAGTGISEIINQQGAGGLTELLEELRNNTGENAEMARVRADNLGGDLKSLRSAWEEVGISITDTNEGPLRQLVQTITEVMRGVGDWIKANPELAGTIAKVVGSLIALATVGGAVTMMMASILGPIIFTRFAMTTLGIKAGGLGKSFVWLAKTAIPWVATALKGLLVAMGPIGWGIMALAATALVIYKYWEPIKGFFLGLWKQVKDAFGDGIGGVSRLLINWSPLGLLYSGISSALGRLGIELPGSLTELGSKMIGGLSNGMNSALGWVRQSASSVWSTIHEAFGDGMGGIAKLLIDWSPFGLLYSAFVSTLDMLGISVPEGFRNLGGFVIDGLLGGLTNKLTALRERITSIASSMANWFKGVLGIHSPSRVFEGFGINIVEGIINGIGSMIGALRDHVMGMAGNIAGWVQDAMGNAWDAIGNGASQAMEWGKQTTAGMGQGIRDGASRATESAANLANDVTSTVRGWLDINSPSRVFATIGNFVSQGLANGIKDDADSPIRQVRSLANNLRNAAGGLMLGAGLATTASAANIDTSGIQIDARPPLQNNASGQPVNVTINVGGITVNPAPGMDEQALARLVGQEVERAMRDAERRAAAAARRNLYDND
ncbi:MULTISPECIES: phage tail tape measure protein [unclassified Halomonas]|uniref:phage tail tape measure protein n=1 Tax=unclassified Halomonas TaxID=2609666 RepID=UPI000990866C|nr:MULTISPECIES: phage tail tape measure protein [unclassified Halomonas]AQU84916.1 phage tail tape measure protein [Halomonas sp. 'Soap Lake \